jgi:chromosome transmission fidelity protein 18
LKLTVGRPLDTLTAFHIKSAGPALPTRFAVRQVLDQELRKERILQRSIASQGRSGALSVAGDLQSNKENQDPRAVAARRADAAKLDFFGRPLKEQRPASAGKETSKPVKVKEKVNVFVTFHEGFSNAVRKPITLKELMDSF